MKKNKNLLKVIGFFLYLLIVWGGYRAFFSFSFALDELFFKPLLWLVPVLWLVLRVEKEKLSSLGLVLRKPALNFTLGIGISLFILGEYLLAMKIKAKPIGFNPEDLVGWQWPVYFFSCVGTGVVEEVVFRGFLMTRLNRVINQKLVSNIIVGLLFFVIHWPILLFVEGAGVQGIMEFFVLSVSLGVIDGYVFWQTRGILAPIVAHASLNFFSLLVG